MSELTAVFSEYEGEVLPAWIDSNDHMNLAYYTVLFDQATDSIYDAIGIGRGYKEATSFGTFAAETHNLYELELLVHERVRVDTHLVAVDAKRLHLAHEMVRCSDGKRAACQELLYLHVDLRLRKVVPWPTDRLARMREFGVSRPDWVGRAIKLPK